MAKLDWGVSGSHLYEAGVDQGVLYVSDKPAVPWVGLISVEENPSGGESRPIYVDGFKFSNTSANEEFAGVLTAFAYPDEFAVCDGSAQAFPGMFIKHQRRKSFGLSYRTKIGNEIVGLQHGYKIHILYNLSAQPTQQENQTLGDSIEALNFTWNLTSRPEPIPGYRPSAHIVIDSRYAHPSALATIEQNLYGDSMTVPHILSPTDLISIFDMYGELVVVDNGDGTFKIIAPSTMLSVSDAGTFVVDSPAVTIIDANRFSITS